MSTLEGFSTKVQAAKRGRYLLADSTVVRIGDGERVGVGTDSKQTSALVWEFGAAQQALPLHAVASAVATGKTIPFDALVAACAESDKLSQLKAALTRYENAVKKQTPAQ